MSYYDIMRYDDSGYGTVQQERHEWWLRHAAKRDACRMVVATILPLAKPGKGRDLAQSSSWGAGSVLSQVSYHLAETYANARKTVAKSREILNTPVGPVSRAKDFLWRDAHGKLDRAFTDWRPNKARFATFEPVMRLSDERVWTDTDTGNNNRLNIDLSAANIMRRKTTGVPWVVTDRFILRFEGCMEKTRMPDGDWVIPCDYLDEKFVPRSGYLAYQSGFYGCAVREFDATKAARMKATQHVTMKIVGKEKKNG